MLTESRQHWPEPDDAGFNFKDTELTLGLPGGTGGTTEAGAKAGTKRGFSQTVDLNLGRSYVVCHDEGSDKLENDVSDVAKPQGAKAILRAEPVGWPPVRASRKNLTTSCKFVKVAVDGAPYLRKVDLERYNSYEQLLSALEDMFSCLAIQNQLNMRDPANGVEYVSTFEDKEGDWMLVGDVPWKMFIESCKRIRLMKSSDAAGLGPRTPRTTLVCFG